MHHQKSLTNGWVATAKHCLELAKVHLIAIHDGGFCHEDLLCKQWTKEEQRILLDKRQETMKEVQRRMPAPLIGFAGTYKKGRPPPKPKKVKEP